MKFLKFLFLLITFNLNAETISLMCSTDTFFIKDNKNNIERGDGGENRLINIDLSNGFITDDVTKYEIILLADSHIIGLGVDASMESAFIEFNRYTGKVITDYPTKDGGRIKINGICEKTEKKF